MLVGVGALGDLAHVVFVGRVSSMVRGDDAVGGGVMGRGGGGVRGVGGEVGVVVGVVGLKRRNNEYWCIQSPKDRI